MPSVSYEQIVCDVTHAVANELHIPPDIMPDTFVKDLNADSLSLVVVILELEEKYNVTVNPARFDKLLTVRDVIDEVFSLVNKDAATV